MYVYIYIHMTNVCMYACMYAHTYVCMYIGLKGRPTEKAERAVWEET